MRLTGWFCFQFFRIRRLKTSTKPFEETLFEEVNYSVLQVASEGKIGSCASSFLSVEPRKVERYSAGVW